MRQTSKLCAIALLCLVIGGAVAAASPAGTSLLPLPDRFRVHAERAVSPGIAHLVVQSETTPQTVHVARIRRGAPVALRAVVARGVVDGAYSALEPTSRICARTRCLVAVNGDFFGAPAGPVGALASRGEPLRSPSLDPTRSPQLLIDALGRPSTGPVAYRGVLRTESGIPIEFESVNRIPRAGGITLYTPRFARSTQTPPGTVEITLRGTGEGRRLRFGRDASVVLERASRSGDAAIPRAGFVLAARGAGGRALLDLWRRERRASAAPAGTLRVDASPAIAETMGGHPVLVRDGRPVFPSGLYESIEGRHPRTVVGWTATGDVLLVAVDGRQPGYSPGMTFLETANLLIGLGAVEAINLDGGGSTSFVVKGKLVNKPSDRAVRRRGALQVVPVPRLRERVVRHVERPVKVALVVVPAPPATAPERAEAAGPARSVEASTAPAPRIEAGVPLAARAGEIRVEAEPAGVAVPSRKRGLVAVAVMLLWMQVGAMTLTAALSTRSRAC